MAGREDITMLLQAAAAGDAAALQRLMPIIYDDLRGLAHRNRLGQGDATLNTTALVNEAYLRLAGKLPEHWPDRRHFYAYAAQAMRNIAIDYARRSKADKRGGPVPSRADETELEGLAGGTDPAKLVELETALIELERNDPRLAEVVNLHVFAGLDFDSIAECLQLTARTVYRDWDKARMFLNTYLHAQ